MRYAAPFLLLLASCASNEIPTRDPVPSCGALAYSSFIGGPVSRLQEQDLPRSVRILRPDQAITLDYSPDRLTVDVDQGGRVSSITCR